MLVKTSELQGAALDWVVANIEHKVPAKEFIALEKLSDNDNFWKYRYSTDWAQGGPIIEREIHKIWRNLNGTFCAQIKFRVPYYSPTYDADIGRDAYINKHGDTPLEAAMRCYVASKLGESVDIPEELL